MPEYAVLIPTHEHGALLDLTLASVRAQTAADFELLVVGDGAGADTAAVVERHAAQDERVRWFPFEKGPRHGELHRHRVLSEHATAPAVLYCSDDDLWLPDHARRLLDVLAGRDFAHALSTWFNVDGTVQATFVDVGTEHGRDAVMRGERTPGLTVAAHTLDAYRRLPHGWRTTPAGTPTDRHMWRQFLGEPWVRAASGRVGTVVHLPSPQRRDWSPERRLEELRGYAARTAEPAWRLEHAEALLALCFEEDVWRDAQLAHLQDWGTRMHEWGLWLEARREEDARSRVWRAREWLLDGPLAPVARRLTRR